MVSFQLKTDKNKNEAWWWSESPQDATKTVITNDNGATC